MNTLDIILIVWLGIGVPFAAWYSRKQYVAGQLGDKVWGEEVRDGEAWCVAVLTFVAGLFWPILLTVVGVKYWFNAPIRAREAKRSALQLKLTETCGLMNLAKTPEERQIINEVKRDLRNQLDAL